VVAPPRFGETTALLLARQHWLTNERQYSLPVNSRRHAGALYEPEE
jgi:hypothetical protein